MRKDHERIWLSPECEAECHEGRTWCSDEIPDCDEPGCGEKAVEYVRAAALAAANAERDELRGIRDGLVRILEERNAENARLRETQAKLLKTNVLLQKNLREAQVALCPRFVECGDKEGEGCVCFPGDGPYGNAIPPNRATQTGES